MPKRGIRQYLLRDGQHDYVRAPGPSPDADYSDASWGAAMSTDGNSRAFEEWVEEARKVLILDELTRRGIRMKGTVERSGPCPSCGGTDRFSINTRKNIFNCRGAGGGNVIAMVEHLDSCSFMAACETLTGRPPPGRDQAETVEECEEREKRLAARAEQRRKEEAEALAWEERERQETQESVERLWQAAKPVSGTHAAAYLEARGLTPPTRLLADLRFVPDLEYHGYANAESDRTSPLGSYPTMLAAIRSVDGTMIGLHRTYLDPSKPKKLIPPGDPKRNKAKKVLGEAKGGMIRLGEIGETLAIGEGIETVLSWYVLGLVDYDVTLATSISLGNLSGAATGTVSHPKKKRPDGSPLPIPNGIPDLDRPGVILPKQVRCVILLGDGDSDPETTRARLLVAARRFHQQGREVLVSMAHAGMDFNDSLLAELGMEAAA